MNKIIAYINNLDKKNFIMLLGSIFILIFIVIYYINNYFAPKELKINSEKQELIKKISKLQRMSNKILVFKQKNKLLKTRLFNMKKDLRYLLSEIYSSNVLIIDNKKFLKILHNFIKAGAKINASFKIRKNNSLDKYKIYISGRTSVSKFFDLTNFLKVIQSSKAIINIKTFNAFKNKDNFINYEMNLTIWSFK